MSEEKETGGARTGIQVIARAADVLRALQNNQSGMSLGQIAARVGLPRSTVQRIVGALQTERFIIADSNGGGLRLGPELRTLAGATKYNIIEQCRLVLTELSQRTGETSDLSVLRGEAMIFLDQVAGTHRLRTVSSVGDAFPLTTSANGRACLAALPRDTAIAIISHEWERRSIQASLPEFLETLDQVQETGLAYDEDEHTSGVSAIGFAFSDIADDLHAISVPVPSTRFHEVRAQIEDALKETKVHVKKIMDRAKSEISR